MGLKYVGSDKRTDWLPGVPARDLSDEEAQRYPEAAESALYELDGGGASGQPAPQPTESAAADDAADIAAPTEG